MATFYLPSSGGYVTDSGSLRYKIEITEGVLSGRSRPVTIKVIYWRTTQATTYGTGTCYCTVTCNGTALDTLSQAITPDQKVTLNSMTVLLQKTVTVSYDNNGDAALEVKARGVTNNESLNSAYNGGTVNLTNIGPPTFTLMYKGSTNDDYGFPASQTAAANSTITLSTHTPARTGYTFKHWNTKQDGTGTAYAPGASYKGTTGTLYLYAQWTINTYTVSYNANGGLNAPPNQTKTYGTTLTLSTAVPTRQHYTFLGWGVSASSTTVSYAAGASYTANADVTLYAIWERAYTPPRITGLNVFRCNSSGAAKDDGTYFKIECAWSTDLTVSSIVVTWKIGSTTKGSSTISASGTSGNVSSVLGGGNISIDSTYNVSIKVADATNSTTLSSTVSGVAYPIDFMPNGTGVAFGKPAETNKLFEVDWDAKFNGSAKISGDVRFEKPIAGMNLLRNSSFTNGHSHGWTENSSSSINHEFVTDNDVGICAHISGELNVTKFLGQNVVSKLDTHNLDQTYVFSAEIKLDNYVAGTTNPFLRLYMDGAYNNNGTSKWLGATDVDNSSGDLSFFNNKGWVRVSRVVKFAHPPTSMRCFIYTRDFTGDLYFRNVKFEFGSTPTYWSPSPQDAWMDVYPVGSIYLAYDHTSPASLFGGTWTRVSPYFLYAAGETATIGETGMISTDTGTNNAHFIKISAWRRTA